MIDLLGWHKVATELLTTLFKSFQCAMLTLDLTVVFFFFLQNNLLMICKISFVERHFSPERHSMTLVKVTMLQNDAINIHKGLHAEPGLDLLLWSKELWQLMSVPDVLQYLSSPPPVSLCDPVPKFPSKRVFVWPRNSFETMTIEQVIHPWFGKSGFKIFSDDVVWPQLVIAWQCTGHLFTTDTVSVNSNCVNLHLNCRLTIPNALHRLWVIQESLELHMRLCGAPTIFHLIR